MLRVAALVALAAAAAQQGSEENGEPAAFPPDRFGAYIRTIEGLRGPADAVWLADGSLLIAERDADRLLRVASDGARAPFGPALDAPEDVAVLSDGRVLAADTGNDRILLLDAEGRVLRTIEGQKDGPGAFRGPAGLAGAAGRIYAADPRSGRVAVFDEEGAFQRALAGPLVRPAAVEVAPGVEVFVADAGAHRVEVFGPDGEHRYGFGDFGPHPGLLGHPR